MQPTMSRLMKPPKKSVQNNTHDDDKTAFETFGQSFLAQFGPLPPSKKRKADTQLQKPVVKKTHATESRKEEVLSEATGSDDEEDNIDSDDHGALVNHFCTHAHSL